MAKLKYISIPGAKNVRKKSKATAPIANAKYQRLHDVIYKEIQKQNSSYAVAALRAASIQISNNSSTGYLNGELQYAIDELKSLGVKHNIPCEIGGINIYEQILPASLIVPNQLEPKAQRIIQRSDSIVSRKPGNILFYPSRMLQILSDILLLGKNLEEKDVISIIQNIYFLVKNYISAIEIELDDNCAKIIMVLYNSCHSKLGIDEATLRDKVQNQYPEINEKIFNKSIKLLEDYSCINILDGKLFLIESIGQPS